ncbi:hypothetical protein Ddc_19936 [Ditylenchus destructor]|nr:hypothetical protein Ddc_19936 [Ditylenchus destructor]
MSSNKSSVSPVIIVYAFAITAVLVLFIYYCIGFCRSVYSDEMNNVGHDHMFGLGRGLNFDASLFII